MLMTTFDFVRGNWLVIIRCNFCLLYLSECNLVVDSGLHDMILLNNVTPVESSDETVHGSVIHFRLSLHRIDQEVPIRGCESNQSVSYLFYWVVAAVIAAVVALQACSSMPDLPGLCTRWGIWLKALLRCPNVDGKRYHGRIPLISVGSNTLNAGARSAVKQ